MFDGLATLALLGIVFIALLVLAAPFAIWWVINHVSISIR
jgi:hypothetical protein